MSEDAPLAVGVVGVGSMGHHHARVYSESPDAELVGIADVDEERAAAIADRYETTVHDRAALLEAADAVSVAVPTEYHAEVIEAAIDADTAVLVEKPIVADPETGRRLVDRARAAGVPIQVGHVERFNPAIRALQDVVADLDVIAIDARRLGPSPDRTIRDSVVLDLMIHDIDVALSLLGADVADISAAAAENGQYATTTLEFEDGTIGTLTASRVTQQKVRTLSITARDCQVNVDYLDRSIRIHRHSLPEWVERDGGVQYRHESIIEEPSVENGEPLKKELASFIEAVRSGTDPVVTGEDGLRALRIARRVDEAAGIVDRDAPETDLPNPQQ